METVISAIRRITGMQGSWRDRLILAVSVFLSALSLILVAIIVFG